MSRLYGRLSSDKRKIDATVGAYQEIECRLTWGSANNPKTAVLCRLVWYKGQDCPSLRVDTSNDINVIVYDDDGPQFRQLVA